MSTDSFWRQACASATISLNISGWLSTYFLPLALSKNANVSFSSASVICLASATAAPLMTSCSVLLNSGCSASSVACRLSLISGRVATTLCSSSPSIVGTTRSKERLTPEARIMVRAVSNAAGVGSSARAASEPAAVQSEDGEQSGDFMGANGHF